MRNIIDHFCQAVNLFGLISALPLLAGVAMSFDHASDPPHWTHLAYVVGTPAFPTLSLAGVIAKRQRYLGLVGLGLAALASLPLILVCHGQFRCAA